MTGQAVRVLQKDKSLVSMAAFAPGLISAAGIELEQTFVVDAESDKAIPMERPLLLVDRQGNVGLFFDPGIRKVLVGKIEAADTKGAQTRPSGG